MQPGDKLIAGIEKMIHTEEGLDYSNVSKFGLDKNENYNDNHNDDKVEFKPSGVAKKAKKKYRRRSRLFKPKNKLSDHNYLKLL